MGSIDLKERLQGPEPLSTRLRIGEKTFLAPLKVPVSQKEDVVVLWLSQLLTNKVGSLSPEEQVAAWTTLSTLLSSERLKALCANNWVCPITSSFTETLVDVINISSSTELQEKAVSVCHSLVSNPALAPLVTHSLTVCLLLAKGLLSWLLEGHTDDLSVTLATRMITEVGARLHTHLDKLYVLTCVSEHLLLLAARLAVSLRHDERKLVQELLRETKSLITTSLFPGELISHYSNAFSLLFSETKAVLNDDIVRFLLMIVSYIESEPVEVLQYLLGEIYHQFLMKFKGQTNLHCQMLIILCHALGVTIQNPKLPSIVQKSFAAQKLRALNTDDTKKEALMYSLLHVIQEAALNITKDGDTDTLLKSLGESLVVASPASVEGYRCLEALLVLIPQFTSNLVLKNLWNIYCCKAPGSSNTEADLHAGYDALLCEGLEVCVRLRNIPRMLEKMLAALKEESANLKNQAIPESLDAQEGRSIFPPRFVASLRRTVSGLSHRQVLPVWKAVLFFLTKESTVLLKTQAKPGDLEFVSLAVWLLAVVVEASPSLQVATVAGDAGSLAEIMTQIALSGIQPLGTVMLTHPHNNNVCASLLTLCHAWGDLHSKLLTTEVGYCQWPSLPKVLPFNPSPATDFSHLYPFIPPDAWAQISARVANFGNKAAQLALVQLVIQKFSQASLGLQKGVLCEDTATQQTAQAITQQAVDNAGKYLTNALELWGSNVSGLFTVHLTYMLPFFQASHLSVIARHLVSRVQEGDKAWREYVSSQHFEEASPLHPHVLSSLCAALATLHDSRKRKLSECEDGPSTSKNYCLRVLRKMSRVAPLLVEFDSAREEENALWEVFQECGECLMKMIEKESTPGIVVPGCKAGEFQALISLITKFPLNHLSKGSKTAILLVLLSLLVQESVQGRGEHFSGLVSALNQALGFLGTFRLYSVTKASSLMRWLIEKRASLYGSMLSQHMASLPQALLKANGTYTARLPARHGLTRDAEDRYGLDHLLLYLTFKLTWTTKVVDQVREVADYITGNTTLAAEALLQPAVFLLAACHLKGNTTCQWVRQQLSAWLLHYLKKMDLDTTSPAAAATVLTAHTIIVQTMAPALSSDKPEKDAKTAESSTTELEEAKDEARREGDTLDTPKKPKDEASRKGDTPDTPKKLKWRKLLRRSVQLAELCLSSGNQELEEYALTFLFTVAKHSDVLQGYLPTQLLATAWSALSQPERFPLGSESAIYNKVSLEPVLLTASPEDYEKLLEDLVARTNRGGAHLCHTLQLWRLVIGSMATGANGFLKRTALEHLIPILVHLATTHGTSEATDTTVLHAVLLTLQEIIQTSIAFEDQTRAHILMPCAVIQLHALPLSSFCQIFNTAINIVNSIVVEHSSTVVERTPAVLAAISHLTTSLITQASQERRLEDNQIKELVGCSSNLERLVKELAPFKVKLNKVVHFTMATIVVSLQHTTVYPAVKMVLESVVYRLLDLCDSYCLQHLLVALPPAATTLLKHLHDNYSTFHRFNPGKA